MWFIQALFTTAEQRGNAQTWSSKPLMTLVGTGNSISISPQL
jgi:hypothetical protein